MKRRDFLRRTLQLSAAGLIVPPCLRMGSVLNPETAFAGTTDPFAGQILIIINLSGGNDGINTVVPYNDGTYHSVRPTLALDPSEVVQIEPGLGTGLHPGLQGLESLYDLGKLAIIQGVGYPEMNLSHFRGTDIWFSGSSTDDVIETGWMARFIEETYPDYPSYPPPGPFGLQQSLAHRIPLQGDRSVTGVVVDNPSTFFDLVNGNYSGDFDDELPDTRGGDELSYIRDVDKASFEYAAAIQAASEAGTNTVVYPNTTLGGQLEIVSRLISGSLGTPLYLTAEYGFDTHADQLGGHAALMASVGGSIRAFMDDLTNQGLSDRVLVITQSEFGRRVEENGGFGTDHGTAAPMFVVGDQVNGGMYGTNPNLTNLDPNNNLLIQNDYRSVYGTILQRHFGASQTSTQDVLFGDYGTIDFMSQVTSVDDYVPQADRLYAIHPNPQSVSGGSKVRIRFDLARDADVRVDVFDMQGRRRQALADQLHAAGRHQIEWRPDGFAAGTYVIRLSSPRFEKNVKAVLLP